MLRDRAACRASFGGRACSTAALSQHFLQSHFPCTFEVVPCLCSRHSFVSTARRAAPSQCDPSNHSRSSWPLAHSQMPIFLQVCQLPYHESAVACVSYAETVLIVGHPDPAPSGHEQWRSPIVTPSPSTVGLGDWAEAVSKARAFVKDLTLDEKVNLTSGIGLLGPCLGNTGSVPRKNFAGFCLQDGPAGVRRASKYRKRIVACDA